MNLSINYIIREKLIQERKLYKQFKLLFNSIRPQIINTIQLFGAPVFDKEKIEARIHFILRQQTLTAVKKFGTYKSRRSKKDIKASARDIFRQRLLDELDNRLTERVSRITNTLTDFLRTYGTDPDQYADSIRKRASLFAQRFTIFSEYKAKQLAVTEVNSSVELVKQRVAERHLEDLLEEDPEEPEMTSEDDDGTGAVGLLAGAAAASLLTKTWVAVLDSATRPEHVEADGQEVPVDEPFEVGGEDLMYPGDDSGSPENVINCRCTAVYSDGSEYSE